MPEMSRFVDAQAGVYGTVLAELRAGRKQTHWMWFIFPQLAALGRSPTAKFYGLAGLEEAREYLRHEVLGPRLLECTGLVNAVSGRSAHEIFAVISGPGIDRGRVVDRSSEQCGVARTVAASMGFSMDFAEGDALEEAFA